MAFTTNKLDPLFENNDLKASGTGIYQEVFDNIDYGDQTPEEAVETLHAQPDVIDVDVEGIHRHHVVEQRHMHPDIADPDRPVGPGHAWCIGASPGSDAR